MNQLQRLSPTERIIAWRLAEGRSVLVDELVAALYSRDPDGGPLTAYETIGQFVWRIQRKLSSHGVTIWSRFSVPHLGYLVPASDLARFRDLLAGERVFSKRTGAEV